MARERDKDRQVREVAAQTEAVADDDDGKKRRLAKIAATLEDLVYGQEMLLAKIHELADQIAEQKRLIRKLTAPAAGAEPAQAAPAAIEAPSKVFGAIVPEMHNPASGRLDARRVAAAFGLTLSLLARVLGRNLSTVSKTPDADALQDRLAAFERIASALVRLGLPQDQARIWAKTPGPMWDGRTPEAFISEGLAVVVAQRLEDSIEEDGE